MINKMDRLILELGLSPQEAYTRLKGIITHVNMIVSAFQSEQHISEADAVLAHEDAKATLDDRWRPMLLVDTMVINRKSGASVRREAPQERILSWKVLFGTVEPAQSGQGGPEGHL